MMKRLPTSLLNFLSNRRGVAAVEFALIFPVMAAILLGAVETSQALEAKRKQTSVAATVADLVAQEKSIDNADKDNILEGGSLIMAPFDPSNLTIIISSIIKNSDGDPEVDWSDATPGTTPLVPGTVLDPNDFPVGILVTGSSVIMADVTYSYSSPYNWNITGPITMHDTYYARPRRSVTVVRKHI